MKKDNWEGLKHIGYCWAKLPPDDDNVEFSDFVNYAKFQLCRGANRLMKDQIWDTYTQEEILIEYYALLFHNNEEQAKQFLASLNGVADSDYDWILEQSDSEVEQLDKQEDVVSFNPQELGE